MCLGDEFVSPFTDVTVLVIMRDHEAFVADCFNSIFRELGGAAKIICVDVGSTDETVLNAIEVGRQFDSSPVICRIDRSTTPLDAISVASEFIRTYFVSVISADDAFGKNYGLGVLQVVSEERKATVTCFDLEITDDALSRTGDIRSPSWTGNPEKDMACLFKTNPGTAPGMLLPWECVVASTHWRTRPKTLIEDYWLWWALKDHVSFHASPIGSVMYRRHAAAISNQSMNHLYAYSLGYCTGIARANSRTLTQWLWSIFLAARWARRVPFSRLRDFANGRKNAKLDWS